MKKIIRFLTSSKFILLVTFIINVIIFSLVSYFIGLYVYTLISTLMGILALIFLLSSNDEPPYKIMWVLIIMFLPLYGTILYFYLRSCRTSRKHRKKFGKINHDINPYLVQDDEVWEKLEKANNGQYNQAKYVFNMTRMPVYQNTEMKYLKNGEIYFKQLIEDLKQAKKFVFMQYFIIEPGKIWDDILKILIELTHNGVEVKILYDDYGCLDRFKRRYFKNLAKYNIQTLAFNRVKPTINKYSQYRDHRKICVIDGSIGYVGGMNLGDEYANIHKRFGYWKDTGIRLNGEAVFSLTALFAHNWNLEKGNIDLKNYLTSKKVEGTNMIQPFGSSPLYPEAIARNNYVKLIASAKKYVYITTPYLLLDETTKNALKIAAKSDVDVRIIMPGIPDKKIIWYLGRSHYKELILSGIKVFEYKPGFVHAKMMLVDGITACIGTINFDFRSLYLHFENAVNIYSENLQEIEDDFNSMFEESTQITPSIVKERKWYEKIIASILKFFAPLM